MKLDDPDGFLKFGDKGVPGRLFECSDGRGVGVLRWFCKKVYREGREGEKIEALSVSAGKKSIMR
jgi:hypothetical protein